MLHKFILISSLLVIMLLPVGCGRSRQAPEAAQAPSVLPQRTVRVLCYHNVVAARPGFYDTSVADFEAQLAALKAGGFETISCQQLSDYLANVRDIPARSCLITFDDGRASILETAKPLLDKHGYTATLFLITDSVGAKGRLGWEQVKSLVAAGYEVGSHTVTHMNLTRRGKLSEQAHQDAVRQELEASLATIERNLGKPPIALAYPFGNYDTFVMRAAKDAGYQLAFSIDPGAIDNQSDPWRLSRRMVVNGLSEKTFARVLQTEPLHLGSLAPTVGSRVGSGSLRLTATVHDAGALAGLQVEVGKRSKLVTDPNTGQLTVNATLQEGANLVRFSSPGPPWREAGWVIVMDPAK